MNTIRQIERMEKLHGLILREITGDSLDLSVKLGCPGGWSTIIFRSSETMVPG